MYQTSAGGSANETNIKTLFSNFANQSNRPFIDQDGLTCFFEAINVEMEDPVTLVIAFSMGVKESSKIEYTMFKKGCETFNADSIEKWIKIIPDLKKDF